MNNETQFQKTIIDELGLADLPENKKDQLLVKMTEVVLKRILMETMERLNEEDQKNYEKMVDENVNPEQLEAFLKERIPDYDGMVKKVIADFKGDMENA